MTIEEQNKLLAEIQQLFIGHSDACRLVIDYTEYGHLIDDLIDGDKWGPENILKMANLAARIFSNPFFIQNAEKLSMVEVLINNDYADSVVWEKSDIEWQVKHADVIRHAGYQMFFAVLYLIHGYDTMRAISLRFREHSHHVHLKDIIKDIDSAA